VAVIDELIEWTQKYQTFMRRYMEVTPARRDLCFAPNDEAKWRLILRQEANIDRQIERKTRLLWEMQEVDLKRRQDEQWQKIVRQEEEAAKAREAEARAEEEEQARVIDEVAREIGEKMAKMKEQAVPAAKWMKTGRLSQSKGRGRRAGSRGQGPRTRARKRRQPGRKPRKGLQTPLRGPRSRSKSLRQPEKGRQRGGKLSARRARRDKCAPAKHQAQSASCRPVAEKACVLASGKTASRRRPREPVWMSRRNLGCEFLCPCEVRRCRLLGLPLPQGIIALATDQGASRV